VFFEYELNIQASQRTARVRPKRQINYCYLYGPQDAAHNSRFQRLSKSHFTDNLLLGAMVVSYRIEVMADMDYRFDQHWHVM
jgi:hypothetical protein